MTIRSIKSLLAKHNLHEYNICLALGIVKFTLNTWSHYKDFKGYKSEIESAIQKLINKGNNTE